MHFRHSWRARRCHNISISASAKLNRSMPRSTYRTTHSAALLVRRVENTSCPVNDASMSILVAYMELPWRSSARVITIGSSAVQIFISGRLISSSKECSVVVFPDPVRPHTKMTPCDCSRWPGTSSQSDRKTRSNVGYRTVTCVEPCFARNQEFSCTKPLNEERHSCCSSASPALEAACAYDTLR